MAEGEAQITPPIQEKQVPEGNLIENFNKLFYVLGLVTCDSRIKGTQQSLRPISERTTRAQLLEEYHSLPKEDKEARKKVITEAHARDEIAKQFLNQGNVKITIGNLGEQSAKYTILTPPESEKSAEPGSKPPIFFIPGISNDLDCVGALAQEIAYSGRKIIVVGMPESIMGKVTQEFADAVAQSPGFGPHADFFKGAINALTGDNQVELWGHSTGGPLIAEILNDPDFQQKVSNAVLLCPASSANISAKALNLGILNELRNLISKNMPKYTLSRDRNEKSTLQQEAERKQQKGIKDRIFKTMMRKVCTIENAWKASKVREGGKIVVYSGRQDYMTRSFEIFKGDARSMAYLQQNNPQIRIIDQPDGYHSTPLINASTVIQQVFAKQAT